MEELEDGAANGQAQVGNVILSHIFPPPKLVCNQLYLTRPGPALSFAPFAQTVRKSANYMHLSKLPSEMEHHLEHSIHLNY